MTPLETYLKDLAEIRSTGAHMPETSFYSALARLLNDVGATLKPKVRCVFNLQNRGAGIPDGGLFTPDQYQRGSGEPQAGTMPSRGVIEVKAPKDDAWLTANGQQVSRYWGKYGQVLVTDYRDFVLVARGPGGAITKLESYRLAANEAEFWELAAHPKAAAKRHDVPFEEYIRRVMLHSAPLADPKDLAWFLASYAHATENTPAGRMMRRSLAIMASFYTEQQALDVREGLSRRVRD